MLGQALRRMASEVYPGAEKVMEKHNVLAVHIVIGDS
jgi:hypothetical protein